LKDVAKELDTNKRWVRVLRITNSGFVEFTFHVADEDLHTELIMPVAAFKEFCNNNNARVLTDTVAAMVGMERINFGLQERIR
jgi:phenol/toluene 2-monooxygenase (NADH) P0/A0